MRKAELCCIQAARLWLLPGVSELLEPGEPVSGPVAGVWLSRRVRGRVEVVGRRILEGKGGQLGVGRRRLRQNALGGRDGFRRPA